MVCAAAASSGVSAAAWWSWSYTPASTVMSWRATSKTSSRSSCRSPPRSCASSSKNRSTRGSVRWVRQPTPPSSGPHENGPAAKSTITYRPRPTHVSTRHASAGTAVALSAASSPAAEGGSGASEGPSAPSRGAQPRTRDT